MRGVERRKERTKNRERKRSKSSRTELKNKGNAFRCQ